MYSASRKHKWYQKGFALISILTTMFMFVAFSGSYANTMNWIDLHLGRTEIRMSEGMRWLKIAVGEGIEVDAQQSVVVVEDIPRRAEEALVVAVSGILNNILGTVSQIFSQLIDKIQEMSNVFSSIGKQAGNILLAIQTSIWPQLEQSLSSLKIVDNVLGSGVSSEVRTALGDATSQLIFAEVAERTKDPTAPAQSTPTQEEIQNTKALVAETAKAACNADNEASGLPFSELLFDSPYNEGFACAADLQQDIEAAVNTKTQEVEEAEERIQDRAPANCKQPFLENLDNVSFDGNFNVSGIISNVTNESIQSNFLNEVGSFSSTATIDTLTVDECGSLEGSKDAALAGAQVTPPSNPGASGLGGVIQTFIDTVLALVNDLINSVIQIALNALNSIFNAFPRVFGEGFNQLVGNFNTAIQSSLSGIRANLTVFEDSINTNYELAQTQNPNLPNKEQNIG